LNFGKTVIPVYEAELDALKLVKTNDGCEIDCAAKCYQPDYDNNDFTFDKACMKQCKCSFKFESKTPEQINQKIGAVMEAKEGVERAVNKRVGEFLNGFGQ